MLEAIKNIRTLLKLNKALLRRVQEVILVVEQTKSIQEIGNLNVFRKQPIFWLPVVSAMPAILLCTILHTKMMQSIYPHAKLES